MQAHGLTRGSTQTQQEFAAAVASAYSPELIAGGLTDIPSRLSGFFYRVRFGDEVLSEGEIHQIENFLRDLEGALTQESHRKVKK